MMVIEEHPKDPGIPNSFPYKAELLAELAEQRRKVSRLIGLRSFREVHIELIPYLMIGTRGEAETERAEES